MVLYKKNNKGLSLVELIIALAIFAIAGLAIYGFVAFCTKTFSMSNKNVKLQYEQQIVVNRIRDIVLETSMGISYNEENHRMIVVSDNRDGSPEAYKRTQVSWDSSTNLLWYADGNTNEKSNPAGGLSPTEELADNVKDFSVDLSKLDQGKVTVNITFAVGDKEVTVNPVITLRNVIVKFDDTTNYEEVFPKKLTESYSYVAKIEISRDGEVFAQNKVDTLKMASDAPGQTTSAVYAAIVTARKNYTLSTYECTWTLDTSSLEPGYESCISVTSAGTDANGNSLCRVKLTNTDTKKPADFLKKGYIIVVATSNADTSMTATLRVSVESGGVYPVSIDYSETHALDQERGLIEYKFKHNITYTAPIEDPVHPGTMVNPLIPDGSYKKITYSVTNITYNGSNPDNALSAIPMGAGFTNTGEVNGVFLVNKSMEEHTFTIKAAVTQLDQNGNEVAVEFTISIEKNAIPEPVDVTRPQIWCDEEALRATTFPVYAEWSDSTPEYSSHGRTKKYFYWYEWEIEPVEIDNTWGNDKINSFNNNTYKNVFYVDPSVTVKDGLPPAGDKNTSVTMFQDHQNTKIFVTKDLDWQKSFTFRITVRVKLSQNNDYNSAQYYCAPDDNGNILTSDRGKAIYDSQTVRIKPVSLTLSPAYMTLNGQKQPAVMYDNNGNIINAVFNHSHIIGKGKQEAPGNGYYKLFKPTFEGIYVTRDNISNIGKIVNKIYFDGGFSADLQKQYYDIATNKYTLEDAASDSYKTGIDTVYNRKSGDKVITVTRLFFYIQIIPYKWGDNKFPVNCIWTCQFADPTIVSGKYQNSVTATFEDFDNQKMATYETKPQYEGFYN